MESSRRKACGKAVKQNEQKKEGDEALLEFLRHRIAKIPMARSRVKIKWNSKGELHIHISDPVMKSSYTLNYYRGSIDKEGVLKDIQCLAK